MRATKPLFIFRSFLPSIPCWWLGCSFLFGTARTSQADILFSGQQNIAIPQNFDGVYIRVNLTQPTHVVSNAGDWHINPFFGGIGIANSPAFQPVRSGAGNEDSVIRMDATSWIGGSATFASDLDWGGSGAEDESGHLGSGILQFTDGKAGYLGFRFDSGGGVPLYGWMRLVLTANGNGVIQSWAYDDSGASILAGATGQSGQRVLTGVQEIPTSAATAGDSILLASSGKITFNDGATGGTFSGTIEGAGEIQIGGTGGLRLSGANAFTGIAAVQDHSKLIVADNTNIGSASVALGNSSALIFESSVANNGTSNTFLNTISIAGSNGVLENTGAGTVVVAGAVVGDGQLTIKAGSGNLTLSGTNTYTGATNVSDGKLTIAPTGTINSSSSVTIGAGELNYNSSTALTQNISFSGTGGTLSGSGTISTRVNVTAGNNLGIGNSPGTMNFDSGLTINGSYIYEMVSGTSAADLGNVVGNLTLGGVLDLIQLGTFTEGERFTLLSYSGSLEGVFTDASHVGLTNDSLFIAAGGLWQINYHDTVAGLNGGTQENFITITAITAVPEPSAAVLLGLTVMGLLVRNRSRFIGIRPLVKV
jgi:autotransporter-associated beta strand protein